MALKNAKDGKLLYHLTRLSNLESILEYGLLPRKYLKCESVNFDDIANSTIIEKRGDLDAYVPFHFHPYTAFDYAVKNKYSDEEFIYICVERNLAKSNNFNIIIKHPLSSEALQLYSYDEGFEKIDWETLMQVGNCDAKQVKMAECITNLRIPVDCFQVIFVSSEKIKTYVENLLNIKKIIFNRPYVSVNKYMLNSVTE